MRMFYSNNPDFGEEFTSITPSVSILPSSFVQKYIHKKRDRGSARFDILSQRMESAPLTE